jgi:hypothetical protein
MEGAAHTGELRHQRHERQRDPGQRKVRGPLAEFVGQDYFHHQGGTRCHSDDQFRGDQLQIARVKNSGGLKKKEHAANRLPV